MSVSFLSISFWALFQRQNWLDDYIILSDAKASPFEEDSMAVFELLGQAYFPDSD
ncbi:MAG: hypothetical protein U1E78_09810 [Gammaproteobacteria bacterium]